MSERKHDQWTVAKPIRLDGAGVEVPRPCDLIICPECLAVRYLGKAQLEEREKFMFDSVKGVFCPGCDQLLFDEQGWIEHRAEQRQYDSELKKRGEETGLPSGPLAVAGALEGSAAE